MTLGTALSQLWSDPFNRIIRRWNWKAALTSSIVRGLIFLFANLTAGWRAAIGAMLAEWTYRALTSGFYGAITQTLGEAEPYWQASLAAVVLLPLMSHSLEFTVHFLRHTARLRTSIISSVIFTMISTLFNMHMMRGGVMTVGQGSQSLAEDMKRIPRLIGTFAIALPLRVLRTIGGSIA